jgi:hypothetical protein
MQFNQDQAQALWSHQIAGLQQQMMAAQAQAQPQASNYAPDLVTEHQTKIRKTTASSSKIDKTTRTVTTTTFQPESALVVRRKKKRLSHSRE